VTEDDKTRLDKMLHEMEIMVKAMLDNSTDNILTVNKDHTIMFTNRMLPGMAEKPTFGMNAAEYLPPQYSTKMTETLKTVFEKGENQTFEFDMTATDGTSQWFQCRIAAAKDGNETAAAIVMITDLTKIKAQDAEIEKLKKNATQTTSQLPQDVQALRKDNETLQQQIQKQQVDIHLLSAENRRTRELQDEITALKEDKKQLETENEILEKQSQEDSTEKKIQTQQIKALQEENAQLEQQAKTLSAQNQKTQSLSKELEELKNQGTETQDLRERIKKMEEEAAENAKKLEEAQNQEWRLLNYVEKEKENEKVLGAEIVKEEDELKADYKILTDLARLVQDRMRDLDKELNRDKKQTFIIKGDRGRE
jgi:PAS domain S-box-containing protein